MKLIPETANVFDAVFAVVMLTVVLAIVRATKKRPELDFLDILTGDNGRYSGPKVFVAAACFVSTWAFLHLMFEGQLHEWFFLAYMATWAGTSLTNKVLNNKQTEGVVTTATTTSTTTTAPKAVIVPVAAPVAAEAHSAQAAATVHGQAEEIEAAAKAIQEVTKP